MYYFILHLFRNYTKELATVTLFNVVHYTSRSENISLNTHSSHDRERLRAKHISILISLGSKGTFILKGEIYIIIRFESRQSQFRYVL
jgi:hypothetical protein